MERDRVTLKNADRVLFAEDLVSYIMFNSSCLTYTQTRTAERFREQAYIGFDSTARVAANFLYRQMERKIHDEFGYFERGNIINHHSYSNLVVVAQDTYLSESFNAKNFLSYCVYLAMTAAKFYIHGVEEAPDLAVRGIVSSIQDCDMHCGGWDAINAIVSSYARLYIDLDRVLTPDSESDAGSLENLVSEDDDDATEASDGSEETTEEENELQTVGTEIKKSCKSDIRQLVCVNVNSYQSEIQPINSQTNIVSSGISHKSSPTSTSTSQNNSQPIGTFQGNSPPNSTFRERSPPTDTFRKTYSPTGTLRENSAPTSISAFQENSSSTSRTCTFQKNSLPTSPCAFQENSLPASPCSFQENSLPTSPCAFHENSLPTSPCAFQENSLPTSIFQENDPFTSTLQENDPPTNTLLEKTQLISTFRGNSTPSMSAFQESSSTTSAFRENSQHI